VKRIRGILVLQFCLLFLGTVPTTGLAEVASQNATLSDLLGAVSGSKIVDEIANVSRYSRCVTDPGHDLAINYIKSRLTDLGYTTEIQAFTSNAPGLRSNTLLQNIIAHKPGTKPQAKHLLTVHLDSSPMRQYPPSCNELAPGANDNGSGVGALLEMARVLSKAQFQDDIDLVFFDGEEFGLLGSYYYVNQYLNLGTNALPFGTVINLDMIGYPRDGTTNQTVYIVSNPGESNIMANQGADLVKRYLPGVKYSVYTIGDLFPASRDPNRLSDHSSFWNGGINNTIFLNEDARDIVSGDPRYHSPLDKLYKPDGSLRLDPDMLAAATRTALLIAGNRAGPLPRQIFPVLNHPFEDNWSQADRPVLAGVESGQGIGRGYTWGPVSNKITQEKYTEAPGGVRNVVYFDKARMELTNPATGYVTNGLLVVELSTGRVQLGDADFVQLSPSQVQVAGDPNDTPGANDISPTYATFKPIIERGKLAANSSPVSVTIDKNGRESTNLALSSMARNLFFVPETGHNIPDVFYNWLQNQGQIYDRATDSYQYGKVFDWVSTAGLPIAEAYWVRAKVAGVEQDVLVQLFERRVLTYTPSNPTAFQVEMGNVGQHYYRWRYGK